ncbi:uncharacterized protein LOC122390315 [Amphibalanus amphitrite]|uniref:uncharacterized protein LOC122390315 n=1 Tax=Amphibalanus amphitrite TaxID=1232801 RepID=UPI001C90D60C|nr:uncharacterized protein LOC122390315 [Amphibalanus amphitrite]
MEAVHTHRWKSSTAYQRPFHLVVPSLFVASVGAFCLLLVVSDGPTLTWSLLPDPTRVSAPTDDSTGPGGGGDGGGLHVATWRLVEPALPSHAWFAGDPSCAHLVTRFARPGSLPDARLASYHRSGNTWTRYLLEAATGLVTCGPKHDADDNEPLPVVGLPSVAEVAASRRAVTSSAELRDAGFIAEHVSPLTRTCLVGKTHAYPPTWRRLEGTDTSNLTQRIREDFGGNISDPLAALAGNSTGYPLPAILLVRDPFRALISLRHFTARSSVHLQESHAAPAAFSGTKWRRFVDTQSHYWAELAAAWAEAPQHTLLVSYERLAAAPAAQLRRMLHFLGVEPSAERLRCTLRHAEGAFHNGAHPVVPDDKVFDVSMRRLVWE